MITKIKPLEELVKIVENLRKDGKKIIAKNGSYDIIHPGHTRALYESKTKGDILIVGLDSDASIRRRKGKERPICPEAYRAEVLAAIESVDFVTLIEDSIEFVKAIKPDVYTNGPEWGENCKEAEYIIKNGGMVFIYTRHEDEKGEPYSTTGLVDKIRRLK